MLHIKTYYTFKSDYIRSRYSTKTVRNLNLVKLKYETHK